MSVLPGKLEQALSLAVATLAAGVMPAPMERDVERDAALRKLAAVAGECGWSMHTLPVRSRAGCRPSVPRRGGGNGGGMVRPV
ncbi:hypothetical protein [Acetobacter okinawensis]|uniref:hypothetical protein n=1 Tax=Acetobacter okinawensis TaxID=1076594 RepID=UPI000A69B8C3|nr:hypothetical protein [Acetobacter okinawensis]